MEPLIQFIPPFLLYKIQHWLALPENMAIIHEPKSQAPQATTNVWKESLVIGVYIKRTGNHRFLCSCIY